MGADDGEATALLRYLREDLASFRAEINGRLDKLVTQDAFDGERRRVDEQIARLTADLIAERDARKTDLLEEATERKAALLLIEQKGARTGLWVRWSVGLLIGIPSAIGAIIALTSLANR